MRLTYKDLETKSYRQLIKEGYTQEQLLAKTSDYYLKENKQLIIKGSTVIDGRPVLTQETAKNLSRAIKDLKRGVLKHGTQIRTTARTNNKFNLKNLKFIARTYGKNSYANQILRSYQLGISHHNQIARAMFKYTGNMAKYEGEKTHNDRIDIIVDSYGILEGFFN